MNITQLNYIQLKILLVIYRTGQGHLAATELGLTPSAVSRALNSMREIFSDSLFIRKSTGLVPTEKTKKMIKHIEHIVSELEQIESDYTHFNPQTSTRQFNIFAYDEFVYTLQKVVQERIIPVAPKIKVNIKSIGYDYHKDLATGEIDFAVVYENFDCDKTKDELFYETGDIYILCREHHPIDKHNIGLSQISNYPILELDNFNDLCNPLMVDLGEIHDVPINVEHYTDSLGTAIQILLQSDAITICCNQFTRKMTKIVSGLRCIKLKQDLIEEIKMLRSEIRPAGNYLLYSENNKSTAFNWVKSIIHTGLKEEWAQALSEQ